MYRLLVIVTILVASFTGLGQVNLVLNGDFEVISNCPSSLSQVPFANWTTPLNHIGSSDLFNICGTAGGTVPNNVWNTNVFPQSGDGFVGGYSFIVNSTYREYVADTLLSPLEAGKEYIVSFYYRLGNNCAYASDNIGFNLSDTMPEALTGQLMGWLGFTPTSQSPAGEFLTDTGDWVLYSDTITAMGGEQFIVIGSFDSAVNAIQFNTSSSTTYAYYLYDSVAIVEAYAFSYTDHCFGESTQFVGDTVFGDSALWNFGDPASGVNNVDTGLIVNHLYSDTGLFTVTLVQWVGTIPDTVQVQIRVFPRQTLDLGSDTTLCFGDTLSLKIGQPYSNYLWSDSSTLDSFEIFRDSTVWVLLNGVCDTLSDTIRVEFDTLASFDLPNDTTFCEGQTLILDANLQVQAQVVWNTGDTIDSIVVSQSGFYQMNAINVCGALLDSVTVTILPNPGVDLLPPDTLNCSDNSIFLTRPLNDTVVYFWSDSSQVEVFEVDTTMTVWLAASNECGFSIDTFTAIFNGEINTELGEDTVICTEDSIWLLGTDSLATYVWNTGETSDSISSEVGESKNYVVTITLKDCQRVESREVLSSDTACSDIDCELRFGNVFTPNGDGWNDRFRIESDCDLFQFSMTIYNRWGQLVHESPNISYGWDGYINGETATAGTYFFTVQYKDFVVVDSDRFLTQGSFTLLR